MFVRWTSFTITNQPIGTNGSLKIQRPSPGGIFLNLKGFLFLSLFQGETRAPSRIS